MEFTKPFSEATAEKIDQEVLHHVFLTLPIAVLLHLFGVMPLCADKGNG